MKIHVLLKAKLFNLGFSYSVCTDLKYVLGYLLLFFIFSHFWLHSFQSLVLKFPQAAFSKIADFVGVIGLVSTHKTHYSLFILSSSINTFAALRPAPFCMPVISAWWMPSCFCKPKGVARVHFGWLQKPNLSFTSYAQQYQVTKSMFVAEDSVYSCILHLKQGKEWPWINLQANAHDANCMGGH